ncbi:uncharacterized protein LOC122511079 [Leptopilina heterotoma]|uniref:uncharacterized protein LOC122511079 n=1 Tax=Leptopilina heterotoma TaxID=63436 RepID=UPI001CA838AC|nr:uncharacterized protein LOC122511079 [Leptopilina heterotoma]
MIVISSNWRDLSSTRRRRRRRRRRKRRYLLFRRITTAHLIISAWTSSVFIEARVNRSLSQVTNKTHNSRQFAVISRTHTHGIMSNNQTERAMSRLEDNQHFPESVEIPMTDETASSTTNENIEVHTRLTAETNNSEDECNGHSPNGKLRIDKPICLTIEDDDNPPPYSALIPQNHAAWYYKFSPENNSNTVRNSITLEQFQQRMTTSNHHHNNETCPDCTRPNSLDSTFVTSKLHSNFTTPDNLRIGKMSNLPRRYGTILMAVIVVLSLMVLSLIVRFVVERSFSRS